MNQALREELHKFVLYLENCDGIEWNKLMRDLSCIHKENSSNFSSLGVARASEFVSQKFGQYFYSFCPSDLQSDFHNFGNEIKALAAADIVNGAGVEFELDNYFD